MSIHQTSARPHQLSASPFTSLPSRAPSAPHQAIPGTPPNPDSKANLRARLRLPPTIEPALVDHAYTARQSFSQALAADQNAALQPDYKTSFRSANDVVKRLLPYHVWHVNEDDLRWTLDSTNAERQGSSTSSHKATSAKRSRDDWEIEEDYFPTSEESEILFTRYSSLHARARRLRYELTGGTSGVEGTLFCQESMYNIEKLAVEQERELLSAEHEKLRQAKEKAIEMGVSWDTLMRLGPSLSQAASASSMGPIAGATATPVNGYSSMSFQKSVGSIHSGIAAAGGRNSPNMQGNVSGPSSLPSTPTNANAKPRGRPRKTRDQDGKIIATPPTIKPADQHKPSKSSSSTASSSTVTSSKPPLKTPTVAPKPPVPLPASPSSSQPATPAVTIPSHPIPLVLPLSTLARLSSLGIAPVPAPHLLPAISAQQAQRQSQGSSPTPHLPISAPVHSTAPRPAPLNQQEPALLMGITEAPLPRKPDSDQGGSTSPSNNHATQQMLHVSVVLSKLSPSQLSGLANLMQSLQTNSSPAPTAQGGNRGGAQAR